MSVSKLPLEIIEAILHETKPLFPNLDVATLASASLVNVPWHISSRRIRFGTVVTFPETVARFVDLFASPKVTLPEFIRVLIIWMKQENNTGLIDCDFLYQLAPVIAKLPHLRTLRLYNIDRTTFNPILCHSLRPYHDVTALEMHYFTLLNLAQLVDIMSLFPVLEELTFNCSPTFGKTNALPSNVALHGRGVPVTLRRFTLSGPLLSVIESIMEWISGTPEGVNIPLEYLKLGGMGFRVTKSLTRLLRGAGSHLRELHLHSRATRFCPGWDNPDIAPTLIDLSANDRLRIIAFGGEMQPAFCDAMLQILSQVTSISLKEVIIPSVVPSAPSEWSKKIEALHESPPFVNSILKFNTN